MKKLSIVLILAVSVVLSGCSHSQKFKTQKPRLQHPVARSSTIRVGSFNIQVFGQSKMSDAKIMDVLAKIIKRYDIIAIQEVRSTKENVIPKLLSYINKDDLRYDYVISKRLGRTGSKEQYAFVYNTKTVNLIPGSAYVVDDPKDVFEREPFVAYFRSGNFDFKIVDIHIKPEDVEAELIHLESVINDIYKGSSEKDIIVLGDMNADGSYFNEKKMAMIFPFWIQLIDNSQDTTVAVSENTYDRMMTREETANEEYDGISGVFNWDKEYGVTDSDFVKKVSDHYPIYAEFKTNLLDDD